MSPENAGSAVATPLNDAFPWIMGIVNLTDDSFSGDGQGSDVDAAVALALRHMQDGANVVDIGAESTRPGSEPVSGQEEIARLLPVLERLVALGVPVSVDTTKPQVMKVCAKAGAFMINDVMGFRTPGAVDAVRDHDCLLCVMHMQGLPRDMQIQPDYQDVVVEVEGFLQARADAMVREGISAARIVLDPGFGFGKTLEHNCRLFSSLSRLVSGRFPVLVGVSRKSMLGKICGHDQPQQRVTASVAAALMAIERGAAIIRVHDVSETMDALRVWRALH